MNKYEQARYDKDFVFLAAKDHTLKAISDAMNVSNC